MNNLSFKIALRGLAMGMAEVVPGVSGGTIAFITGIYERLINVIRKLSGFPFGIWRKEGFKRFWSHIEGPFLLSLAMGMMAGILIGVLGISYLLDHYPPIVWGFFFGLIIASVIFIGKQIKRWAPKEVVLLLLGASVAYLITVLSPAMGSDSLPFVFASGAIAVCALILPGISGSLILLLLGMYSIILHQAEQIINERSISSLIILGVFILGCVVGLMLFSNVLSWTFKKYRYPTLAILTGFMIGSLNRIWPWRNPIQWMDKTTGAKVTEIDLLNPDNFRLISELNVAPAAYLGNAYLPATLASLCLGMALVYLFSRLDQETGTE